MAEAVSPDKAKPSPTLNNSYGRRYSEKQPWQRYNSCRTEKNAAKAGKSQYSDGHTGVSGAKQ